MLLGFFHPGDTPGGPVGCDAFVAASAATVATIAIEKSEIS
jgi:hypothetical protein